MTRPWSTVLALLVAQQGPSQQLPVWPLGAPEAIYDQPFDNIRGLRELSDGRVLVLDREPYVVNLDKKMGARLGRSGDGPGEWRAPLYLIPFRGDTTLFFDMARFRRLGYILPNGAIGGHLEVPASATETDPEAADAQGRLYSRLFKGDSIYILRWTSGTGKEKEIAGKLSNRGVSTVRGRGTRPPPFATVEQWAVSQDGRIAIVSVMPYRVTYFRDGKPSTIGPPIAVTPPSVTEAHRVQWREEAAVPHASRVSINQGPYTYTWVRPRPEEIEPLVWPKVLPPFLPKAASFAYDGTLWVVRTTADPSEPRIDVFDNKAELLGTIILPRRTRLVGHGAGVVYLVRVDDDDLKYLERYRLPADYRSAVHP